MVLPGGGGERLACLKLERPGLRMKRGVVEVEAQARAEGGESIDDVGRVQVVGEDVQAQRVIGGDLVEEVEDEVARVEAEPAPALLVLGGRELDRRRRGLDGGIV